MNDSKTSNAPMTLLAGFALGAVAAALVTPKSGDDMRKGLQERYGKLKQRAASKADEMKDMATSKADDVKSAVRKGSHQKDLPDNQNNDIPPIL